MLASVDSRQLSEIGRRKILRQGMVLYSKWNIFALNQVKFSNFRESKYAYNNPTIQPDEELHHRGYLMHKGQIVPRVTR